MNLITFVRGVLGTVPAQYDFIVYTISGVLLLLFVAIFLRFLLGAISGIFYR